LEDAVKAAPIAVMSPAAWSDSPRSATSSRRQPEVERGGDAEADELDAGADPHDRILNNWNASSMPTGASVLRRAFSCRRAEYTNAMHTPRAAKAMNVGRQP